MKQLYELSRKFPKEWIKKAPKGKFGNYVPHPVITQRLLEVCGPFDWEVVELIRQEKSGSVVGCFGKLTVEVDGKLVTVTSIGDVEHDQKKFDAGFKRNLKNWDIPFTIYDRKFIRRMLLKKGTDTDMK